MLIVITTLCTLVALLVLASTMPPPKIVVSAPYVAPVAPPITPTQTAPPPAFTPVVDEVRLLVRASSRSTRPAVVLPSSEATPAPTPSATPTRVTTPEPTPEAAPEPPAVITGVGDSVLKSATGELAQRLDSISVNAVVGRDVGTALHVLQAEAAAGQLGEVVLVHIGANGPFSAYQFQS